jgi:hypothetical protein
MSQILGTDMLNFKTFIVENFLVEGRGEETAHGGFANEHFTVNHINEYVKHVSSGGSHESGLKKIKGAKFDKGAYKSGHPIKNAIDAIGHKQVESIHEDSKDTAHAIINHLRDNYGSNVTNSHHVGKVGAAGVEEVKKLTGKASNADVVLSTKHPKKGAGHALAHLEHVGASLKYSKSEKEGSIKIHSPSISNMAKIVDDHHEQMHQKSAGVLKGVEDAVKKGVEEQRNIVKKHAKTLETHFKSKEFLQNKDKKHVKKYLGKVGSAEDYKSGNLNKAGISYINKNEKMKPIYDEMKAANLKMKQNVAGHLHRGIAAVLDHKSKNPNHAKIKESLTRSIGNVHSPEKSGSLPTFLVSTDRSRGVKIHDITNHFAKHFSGADPHKHSFTKGSSTFRVGPTNIAIDARPSTSARAPLNNPVNVSISAADLKKK